MAWIGGKQGVFRLHSSDAHCGSKVSLEDAAEIFDVGIADISALANDGVKVIEENGEQYVNELDLHKAWGKGRIPTAHHPQIGSAKRSLDELILIKLLKITLPSCDVIPQVKVGRKQVDLIVKHERKELAIEFFGPSHFIPQYGRSLISPSERSAAIESKLDMECVVWPYWIQRCETNVRALFDRKVQGLASVWSTKAHFGDFVIGNAASVIVDLTKRFNALTPAGLGYMYTNERTLNKPIHPIVERIQSGRENVRRLIPKDNDLVDSFWIPNSLVSLERDD